MNNRRPGLTRLCYVDPRQLPAPDWRSWAARAASAGFTHLVCGPLWRGAARDPFLVDDPFQLDPAPGWPAALTLDDAVASACSACSEHRLELWMDICVCQATADGALARDHPHWWHHPQNGLAALDPRLSDHDRACCRLRTDAIGNDYLDFWRERLRHWLELGVTGFRVVHPQHLGADAWRALLDPLRASHPDSQWTAWTPGIGYHHFSGLGAGGFTAGYASLPWWNLRDPWFVQEFRQLQLALGQVYMAVIAPEDPTLCNSSDVAVQQRLWCAACIGDALLATLPAPDHPQAGELVAQIAAANTCTAGHPAGGGPLQQLTGDAAPFTALQRTHGDRGCLVLLNPSPVAPVPLDWQMVRTRLSGFVVDGRSMQLRAPVVPPPIDVAPTLDRQAPLPRDALAGSGPPDVPALVRPLGPTLPDHLPAGGSASAPLVAPEPVITHKRKRNRTLQTEALAAALQAPRIVIQDLSPSTPDPTHCIKRIAGEPLTVRANVFMDGHDVLRVFLLWRAVDEIGWHAVEMKALGNDAWEATCIPERIGLHEYTIRAWRDAFGSFRAGLAKKVEAGVDVSLDVREGQALLARCGVPDADTYDCERLLSPDTLHFAQGAELHEFETTLEPPQALMVERRAARFASWYEMFPRSQSGDAARHGTFRDVIFRLPYVRDMGFDVLYLPPIHPIGNSHRKGRNNSLQAGPDDPGSPYAIGAIEGGHDAVHPQLGTLDDFRDLLAAARRMGIEIALDFAIQCSPDHPWLQTHPEWFSWRADGSLHYAENPPKKYEDIVNLEFYNADELARTPERRTHTMALWFALRDVVLHWAALGVRTFRVDNPHTKPLPFWQWLIREVQGQYPDTIFLSEAFTRPSMMYRLARVGFSQSYTYFTWRTSKQELTDYLNEVGNAPVADFFRPHFFVNTPDINPRFLQTSGRPGFLIRAALAATMSGLWGMYSGFELCEATPLPGREEYLDSEKYEIKAWDWDRPGNIRHEIARLNQLRLDNPALHTHRGIAFHPAHHEQILFYSKATSELDNVLLIAVNLDPFHGHDATIELPMWMLGLPDDGVLHCEDLVHGYRFDWHGKYQTIHLDPDQPYSIWRVRANT